MITGLSGTTPRRESGRMSGIVRRAVPAFGLILLSMVLAAPSPIAIAAGPIKESPATCSRFPLPEAVSEKPFYFCGELVPIRRNDVHSRILYQTNFLLLDARSVLTDWISDKSKHVWLLEELLVKEGIPKDFVWLAPILSGANLKSQSRQAGVGWWSLEKSCDPADGMDMSDDTWHDDRLDLDLATRCFSAKIKRIRKELGDASWLMTAAAYMSGQNTVQDLMRRWNTGDFWDLPLPDVAEDLTVRCIALKIIYSNRDYFGLKFKSAPPFTCDLVADVALTKDLPVAEVARMVGIPSRVVLELNPKLKPSSGLFPAQVKGKAHVHSIAVPKGKGSVLLEKLKMDGYVMQSPKS
ncbi:MAG: hypothetical protein HY912_20700 [Desulfomonile tiedjei]|uniref:Transglycosylase SLT domain-containing protein n=1 Tax=Desulfomonile tiedjei TaxID=2358 RepID=A0A9D6V6R9_9BACT|nr:hypothetical protein [Desulfomonile tiedjei]